MYFCSKEFEIKKSNVTIIVIFINTFMTIFALVPSWNWKMAGISGEMLRMILFIKQVVKMRDYGKQWNKGSVANFICETKSVSKQDAHILIICSS